MMLRLRVLTAAILVPLVIWGVIALPPPWLAIVLGGVLAIGAWEWGTLAGLHSLPGRGFYVLFILILMVMADIAMVANWVLPVILTLTVLWWLLAWRLIRVYPAISERGRGRLHRLLTGILVLVASWVALVALSEIPGSGRSYLLFLILLMWVADSGAYFAGRRWGRCKLAPRVSPGKTWEGVGGALLGTVLIALIAGDVVFRMSAAYLGLFVVLCLVTVVCSILGDLFESLFKRMAGVKDSGQLLPGHGGILDRLDSLTAAAPVFMLGLILMGVSR